MISGRKGRGWQDGTDSPANDAPLDAAAGLSDISPAESASAVATMTTSPAFDRWLDQQMKALFAACEEPADPKLLELIRRTFPPGQDKVTK